MVRSNRLSAALVIALTAAPLIHAATLPRKAIDLKIEMPGGTPVRLNQYRGKAVVVALILTTCSHCQQSIRFLIGMQKEYGPKGLQVVAAAVEDAAKQNVPIFVRQFQTNFPVGYVTDMTHWFNFMQHPSVQVPRMPMLAFIDRGGMIRTQHDANDQKFFADEGQNMRREIEAILKGPAPAAAAPGKAAPKTVRKAVKKD